MKKIHFRKIFFYDPTLSKKYSKYQGYKLIALQKKDPPISNTKHIIYPFKFDVIYTSNHLRGKQTANWVARTNDLPKPKPTYLLNEVKFNISKLATKKEYDNFGSKIIRKRFLDAFIANRLDESQNEIEERDEKFMLIVKNDTFNNYLVISHSFIMKIYEAYCDDHDFFKNPKILKKYIDINNKTYENGKGFDRVFTT